MRALNKLETLLYRAKLLDGDNTLSLTALTLFCVLVKLMTTPELDLAAVAPLLVAVGAYQSKKIINQRGGKSVDSEAVASLGIAVKGLADRTVVLENRTNPMNKR